MSEQSAEIGELVKALAAAQADIKGAMKTGYNPYYKSSYADLSTVMEACREPLSKQGLAVIQTTEGTDGETVSIVTTLAHSSGQWIRGRLLMKPEKHDPQSIGSCLTYGRRYTLAAIVGVAPEDDDGNRASGREGAGRPAPDAGKKPDVQRPAFRKPGPTVPELMKAGRVEVVPPADGSLPAPLRTLMELSGVSEQELRTYLAGKGWLAAGAPWTALEKRILDAMVLDANWGKVMERIKASRKAA